MSEGSTNAPTPITLSLSRGAAQPRAASRRVVAGVAIAFGDVVSAQIALAAACFAVQGIDFAESGKSFWSAGFSGAVALAVLIPNACLGLYDTAGRNPVERFRLRVWGMLIMPPAALAAAYSLGLPIVPLVVLLLAAALFMPLALVSEAGIRGVLIAHSAWGATVALFGTCSGTASLASFLLAHPDLGLRPVVICGDEGNDNFPPQIARLKRLCNPEQLACLAEVAIVAVAPGQPMANLAGLPFTRIIVVPEMTGLPVLWLKFRGLDGAPGFEFNNVSRLIAGHAIKRAVDLLVAVPLLLLALPLIGIAAAVTKLMSPGPAFYKQRRVGLGGAPVAIYKLRSMHADSEHRLATLLEQDPVSREQWATNVKLSPDPRVIPLIGAWMRRFSIDELPQLWNVVQGDMSLVGPRPFPAYHHDRFGSAFQQMRTSVRPGLTGLWQVSARSDADLAQQEQIDTFYIRNWSLWLDLWIILRTLPAVLRAQGAR